MPPDPSDRSDRPGGTDSESERWWQELTRLEAGEPVTRTAAQDARFARAVRRRERADRRSAGGETLGRRGARSMLTFFAILVVVAGVVSLTEKSWQRAREVSYAEGSHLDGTTVQGEAGTYSFLATQGGTGEPVTYGPCRSIEVQINPSGEVPGGSQMVIEAMAHVSELTGLRLTYSGPTGERPDAWAERMTGGELEAYPPVLVSWSDEDETPGLEGDVVGQGGSISLRGGAYARQRYMTGSVTLDGPDLSTIQQQEDGEAQVRAVILHELGHLVGLGHVADPDELMSEANIGQLDFGPGDREGLARLGGESC